MNLKEWTWLQGIHPQTADRWSSHGQKADLDRQVARLTGWAQSRCPVVLVEAEAGTGQKGRCGTRPGTLAPRVPGAVP